MAKYPKKPCMCCGKMTGMAVPFTVCPKCSKILKKYFRAYDARKDFLMQMSGIKVIEFKGEDDVSDNMQNISERVANIRYEIGWLESSLLNIQLELEREKKWRKENKKSKRRQKQRK